MTETSTSRAFHLIKSRKTKGAKLAAIGAAAISKTFSSHEPVMKLEAIGRKIVIELLAQGRVKEVKGRYQVVKEQEVKIPQKPTPKPDSAAKDAAAIATVKKHPDGASAAQIGRAYIGGIGPDPVTILRLSKSVWRSRRAFAGAARSRRRAAIVLC